jgi:hypothetical protein
VATRRIVDRVGVLIGAAVVVLIWGAAPAWAAPSISVDPSTDLADRQVVDVTGTGYPPDSEVGVGVVMCEPDPASFSDCDLDNFRTPGTSSSGSFSTTFDVRRHIQTDGGTRDCASAPGACVLLAASPGFDLRATAPLSFDPSAPPVPAFAMTAAFADRATIDRRSGAAFLTATVACNRAGFFSINVELVQSTGGRSTRASFSATDACGPVGTAVLLTFEPRSGAYAGGDALLLGSASATSLDGASAGQGVSTVVAVVRSK